MKKVYRYGFFFLAFVSCIYLTSCPDDNGNSLSGSQWILLSIDSVDVGYVEYIEFTSTHVNFYDDDEICWDYSSQSYSIDGSNLIMEGGDYSVGFELHGNHLHIFTAESEWVYSKESFDPSGFNLCDARKPASGRRWIN